jgi:FixJ family two-component response regulator
MGTYNETHNLVYLIDDDDFLRFSLEMLLTDEGFIVRAFASAVDFLRAGPPSDYGCVLSDVQMPGGVTGIDLLRKIVERGLDWPVILITGQPTETVRNVANRLGAHNFFSKPVRHETLVGAVRNALESRDLGSNLLSPR